MIAHILKDSGYDCSAFLGGISSNYNSNVLYGENNVVVVEADEYDRSFLTLHPNIAVVTSADPDHLDIYGDERHLINLLSCFYSVWFRMVYPLLRKDCLLAVIRPTQKKRCVMRMRNISMW